MNPTAAPFVPRTIGRFVPEAVGDDPLSEAFCPETAELAELPPWFNKYDGLDLDIYQKFELALCSLRIGIDDLVEVQDSPWAEDVHTPHEVRAQCDRLAVLAMDLSEFLQRQTAVKAAFEQRTLSEIPKRRSRWLFISTVRLRLEFHHYATTVQRCSLVMDKQRRARKVAYSMLQPVRYQPSREPRPKPERDRFGCIIMDDAFWGEPTATKAAKCTSTLSPPSSVHQAFNYGPTLRSIGYGDREVDKWLEGVPSRFDWLLR